MLKLFTTQKLEELNDAVCTLLSTEGMRVHHAPLRNLVRQYGAEVNDTYGTVRFSRKQIDALREKQLRYAATADLFGNAPGEYHPTVDDSIPFVYDLNTNTKRYATKEDAIESLKVQHMIPEINAVRSPTIISEAPSHIEPLLRYRAALEITDKPLGNVGFWDDRLIPYFKEVSAIRGEKSLGFNSANMVISPMIIDEATGRKILTTAAAGYVNVGATPMPTAGGSSPVSVEGTALIAATEILGMALILDIVNTHYHIENPNKITGYCVSGIVDMATLQGVFSAPESILQDLMVRELFAQFYGAKIGFCPHYTDAKLPGMQCVMERVMKYFATAYTGDTGYVENFSLGHLLACTVHSPTQMMIDLELGRAMYHFFCHKQSISISDALAEVKEVFADNGDSFMLTDNTIDHFRENFYSYIMDHTTWKDVELLAHEKHIIAEANDRYSSLLAGYKQPEVDTNVLKALDEIIQSAERNLQ